MKTFIKYFLTLFIFIICADVCFGSTLFSSNKPKEWSRFSPIFEDADLTPGQRKIVRKWMREDPHELPIPMDVPNVVGNPEAGYRELGYSYMRMCALDMILFKDIQKRISDNKKINVFIGGCGHGFIIPFLLSLGKEVNVTAIDYSQEVVQIARIGVRKKLKELALNTKQEEELISRYSIKHGNFLKSDVYEKKLFDVFLFKYSPHFCTPTQLDHLFPALLKKGRRGATILSLVHTMKSPICIANFYYKQKQKKLYPGYMICFPDVKKSKKAKSIVFEYAVAIQYEGKGVPGTPGFFKNAPLSSPFAVLNDREGRNMHFFDHKTMRESLKRGGWKKVKTNWLNKDGDLIQKNPTKKMLEADDYAVMVMATKL